jgi:hypothetical protein
MSALQIPPELRDYVRLVAEVLGRAIPDYAPKSRAESCPLNGIIQLPPLRGPDWRTWPKRTTRNRLRTLS